MFPLHHPGNGEHEASPRPHPLQQKRAPHRFRQLVLSSVAVFLFPHVSWTQGENPMLAKYKSAMESFGQGDYLSAINVFEEMLASGAEGPGVENVRFSLAAALYNAKEYRKARQRFEDFLKAYPKSAKTADALLGVADSQLAIGDKEGAAKTLATLSEMNGPNRERALVSRAALLKASRKLEEAGALIQPLIQAGIRSPESVKAAMLLASLEAEKGNRDRALTIASLLHARLDLLENPLELDALLYEIGDRFLLSKDPKRALQAFHLIRKKQESLSIQQARIQSLSRRIEALPAQAKAEPARAFEFQEALGKFTNALEAAKAVLSEIEKQDPDLPSLRVRQARCYQEMNRHWEAVVALEAVSKPSKTAASEPLWFALGTSHLELGNTEEAMKAFAKYVEDFPKAANVDTALFLQAVQEAQSNQFERAGKILTRLLTQHPKSPLLPEGQFLHANVLFAQGQHLAALAEYQKYLSQFPKAERQEECTYRIALCHFSAGDYEKAFPALEAYRKQHPQGLFASDAHYRIAVCYFAAKKYQTVLELCEQWESQFGLTPIRGEVLSLKADAFAALEKRDEAIAAYQQAVESASTEEIAQYALLEANKLLYKLARWEASAHMLEQFVAKNPEHAATPAALHGLTRALLKQGKALEAREVLASKIFLFIADRKRDAVEPLLSQIAHLCAKPVPPPLTDPSAAPTSTTPPPPPTPYNPAAALASHLDPHKTPNTPLVQARLAFAQSELARLTKRPEEAARIMDQIANQTPPSEMGAFLLAQCGDRLREKGNAARAHTFYQELMRTFPKSELLDYAYNGIGQLALSEGKPEEALRWFEDAVDKAGASSKLRDVTLGKAKALLELGKHDEAKALFEQVASTREWRGDATAESIFFIGETLYRKGDPLSALQYFQRVFVAYQRFEATVAKAYLRAADCFTRMGAPEKAEAHLRELLRKEKLSSLPEASEARRRLALPDPPSSSPSAPQSQ